MNRKVIIALVVMIAIVAAALGARRAFLGPQRYWSDFVGRSDSEVQQMLGTPRYDSRKQEHIREATNVSVWGYGYGSGFKLSLTFSNNIVVSQLRGSH